MLDYRLEVGSSDDGERIDKYISREVDGLSREKLKNIFEENKVFLNGKNVKPSKKIKTSDLITLSVQEEEEFVLLAEDIPLNIIYEDDDIIIVDKPQGMVVHPAHGNYVGTVVNALMHHTDRLSNINDEMRPGIVHRIDKDTSGVIVVAKNNVAHEFLAEQFANHSITRAYCAIVHGTFDNEKGTIDAPIGRSSSDRKKMAVNQPNNKWAVTHYTVLDSTSKISKLDVHLETGRTHQIRVHMKYISHHVVGDRVYGRDTKLDKQFKGQLLHAYLLGFIHPTTKEYVEFRSEIPAHFNKLMDTIDT